MQVLVAKEAEEIAAGLGELTADLAESRGRSFEADAAARSAYWDALVAGEWPLVGAEAEADGGLSDVDLCHVVEQWGRVSLPVPFVSTVLARRWGFAHAATGAAVTLAVPAPGGGSSVPFADWPGVTVLGWDPAPASGPVDGWAPTYPVSTVDRPSPLTAEQLATARVVGVAEAIGTAARALADGIGHALTRQQFNRPIGSFQAVQHHLADSHRDVEVGRSLVLTALQADDPALVGPAVTEGFARARSVVERTIQVYGGMGFTWEVDLHYRLRHVVALADALDPAARREAAA
jgi:alkylation response protein AidB-like acyl-CoA dehydrogenase